MKSAFRRMLEEIDGGFLEDIKELYDEQEKHTQDTPTSEGGSRREASSPTPCDADPGPEDFHPGSCQTQEPGS